MEKGLESYYSVLGVNSECSSEEIRRAYRKLAMQWHPDRWTRRPCLLGEAKRRFQQIQEAYSVLSDQRKRTMYDAGLYDPDDEQDEVRRSRIDRSIDFGIQLVIDACVLISNLQAGVMRFCARIDVSDGGIETRAQEL